MSPEKRRVTQPVDGHFLSDVIRSSARLEIVRVCMDQREMFFSLRFVLSFCSSCFYLR